MDLGDARLRRVRLPALPRPDRGAAALRRQEQPARVGGDAGSGVRRGRHRLDRRRGADGPARPAPPPGDLHLRGVDARDAGRRRLRTGHRDLAARGRLPALQRARDRRHDRLGDAQAAPCAGVDAGPRVEPRLADLDRPPAALVRPDRARGRARGGAADAGRRGRRRRGDHAGRAVPARHARRRARAGGRPSSRRPGRWISSSWRPCCAMPGAPGSRRRRFSAPGPSIPGRVVRWRGVGCWGRWPCCWSVPPLRGTR